MNGPILFTLKSATSCDLVISIPKGTHDKRLTNMVKNATKETKSPGENLVIRSSKFQAVRGL